MFALAVLDESVTFTLPFPALRNVLISSLHLAQSGKRPRICAIIKSDVIALIQNHIASSCGDTLVVLWQTETYVAHFLEVAIVIGLVGDVSLFQLCQKCLC